MHSLKELTLGEVTFDQEPARASGYSLPKVSLHITDFSEPTIARLTH